MRINIIVSCLINERSENGSIDFETSFLLAKPNMLGN